MMHSDQHGYVPAPDYLTSVLTNSSRFHDPNWESVANYPRDGRRGSVSEAFVLANGPAGCRDANNSLISECLVTLLSMYGKRIRYGRPCGCGSCWDL